MSDEFKPKEEISWVSSRHALEMLEPVLGEHVAKRALLKRVHKDMIRTKAKNLVRYVNGIRSEVNDSEIRPQFFWAETGAALSACWKSGDFSTTVHTSPFRGDWEVVGLQFDKAGIDELLAETAPLPADLVENTGAHKALESEDVSTKAAGRPSKSHLEAAAWVCVQVAQLSAADLERETFETIADRMSAAFLAMNETAAVDKAHAMAILRGIRRARPR